MLRTAPASHFGAAAQSSRPALRPSRALSVAVKAQAAEQKSGELRLIGPEPKRFAVAEGQTGLIASAALPALLRLGSGALCLGYGVSLAKVEPGQYAVASFLGRAVKETSAVGSFNRPKEPLILFEFEGKVREAVALLDLDVLFKPCPQGGPTWRPEAIARGGKKQFPYLIDPNTGTEMYESDAIISYLFNTYGDGKVPLGLRLGFLTALSCGIAMLPRMLKGSRYRPAKQPKQPLVYWGYEASPFCKVVRERLNELELAHVQRSCARGSPKRQELFERRGRFQVPYLEDPDNGVALFESSAILEYLESTYGSGAAASS